MLFLILREKRPTDQALMLRYTKYKHLYEVFSALFDISRSQHKGEFLEGVSDIDNKWSPLQQKDVIKYLYRTRNREFSRS